MPLAAPLIVICLLSACTGSGRYRVLLPRAGEAAHAPAPQPKPVSPAPASTPRLADDKEIAELSALEAQAQSGEAAFRQQRIKSMPQIEAARGAPSGSERWITGQQALSVLEATRGPTLVARSKLDSLAIHARDVGSMSQPEITAAERRVSALAEAQDELLQSAADLLTPSTKQK